MQEITNKQAKRFLLPEAIKFYLKAEKGEIYRFMSLYDDSEPYPLAEVVQIQAEKVAELEDQAKDFEQFLLGDNAKLKGSDYQDKELLAKIQKHHHATFLQKQALEARQTLTKLNKILEKRQ